jgi:hypothetical protein
MISVVFLFFGTFSMAVGAPTVLTAQGSPRISTGLESTMSPAKVGLRLREKAVLETGASGLLKIRLDANRELVLFENTRISLPGIRWEGGGVPLVILEQGTLRWTADSAQGVTLRTTLFEMDPPAGDFLFRLDPKTAQAELWVIKGNVKFRALNAESAADVTSGQKILFQGVLEADEIAYDILLKGRRIPRGQMGQPGPMTKAELAPFLEEEKRAKDLIAKAAHARLKKKKDDQRAGLICSNPPGRLNECAWTCVGNRKGAKTCELQRDSVICIRQRCNANGEWADRAEMPKGTDATWCHAKPTVRICDY